MPDRLRLRTVVPASRKAVFGAWLDSRQHAAFTGSPAVASGRVGGKFFAWDGYISGRNLELSPNRRIVQAWRTTDFADDAPDSRLTIEFADAKLGTRITLTHTGIPNGQGASYRQGWRDFYFTPMKAYFARTAKE